MSASAPHDITDDMVLDNHVRSRPPQNTPGKSLTSRRLFRTGPIEGLKIGQVWLVEIASLDAYLTQARETNEQRYGPRVYQEYGGWRVRPYPPCLPNPIMFNQFLGDDEIDTSLMCVAIAVGPLSR